MADESRGTANSLDGRTFEYQVPLDSPLTSGDLVLLTTPTGTTACGQILDKRFEGAACVGTGAIFATSDGEVRLGATDPFTSAELKAAGVELVTSLQQSTGADVPVGALGGAPAMLRSKGFNRHTFLCGQSGSGKSYALGVVLEQILIDTDLPVVILDPNADFVHLGDALPTASPAESDRLGSQSTKVLRPRPEDGEAPLRVRFTSLSTESKAAILQLDPVVDRDEYNTLLNLSHLMSTVPPQQAVEQLMSGESIEERRLAQRIQNLQIMNWDVWARGDRSAVEMMDEGHRALVLDLSGFAHHHERQVVAMDLLEHLWANRIQRQPRLIVIDEAHNVCSANPANRLEQMTTDRLIQIASEGRKYGLWLLLCTQRPSRIHPSVLSQCDNLMVMKMNSRGDLLQLEETFGFAPPQMLSAVPYFRQGEALMAGGFVPIPGFVRMGGRRTREGGSDVGVPLPPD